MKEEQIKERIASSIYMKDPNAEAYLFGSRARGDFRPDSDWDILILVDQEKLSNELEYKFRKDLYDLELEYGQNISILIYPKKFWEEKLLYSPLHYNVSKEGIHL